MTLKLYYWLIYVVFCTHSFTWLYFNLHLSDACSRPIVAIWIKKFSETHFGVLTLQCLCEPSLLVAEKGVGSKWEKKGSQSIPLRIMNSPRVWYLWSSSLIGYESCDVWGSARSGLAGRKKKAFWGLVPSKSTHWHTTLLYFCLNFHFLISMSSSLVILFCVGLLHQSTMAVLMDKLADSKICKDEECSCKSQL